MKLILTILPVFWPKMPPLGLGFLQEYLENKGVDVEVFDLNNFFYNLSDEALRKQWLISCNTCFESSILSFLESKYPEQFKQIIDKLLRCDVVGFSCFKSNFPATLGVVKLLKSKSKDLKVVLGGPEVTRQFFKGNGKFEKEIEKLADLLVVGEGEKPLCDYLSGSDCDERVVKFEQLKELVSLPYPCYKGFDFLSYPAKEAVPLQFSRGCVKECRFCSERLLYQGFRMRTAESLVDEISYHKSKHNTEYFVFFDSMLNADLSAMNKLSGGIIDNFGSVRWEAQIGIRNDMDEALFVKMKKSGCYNLFVGLESGSNRTLKSMNKGFNTTEAVDFFRKLKCSGLDFGVSIILGYPGETEDDFKETLDFVIKNKDLIPKIEQVNPFTYYDGTIADRNADYKLNNSSLERMEIFVSQIKRCGFKYTNAFLGNLIEKNAAI